LRKFLKSLLLGKWMKYETVSIEFYIQYLQDYVVERMQYHNQNGETENTIAIGEEFFELFDPSDDSEILYSHRLKGK
jgi:hypothetical protein